MVPVQRGLSLTGCIALDAKRAFGVMTLSLVDLEQVVIVMYNALLLLLDSCVFGYLVNKL